MPTISMPRLSDTMQEGTIGRWLKQPGDQVKKGDSLAEIETDKATMDLEAFDEGILEQILVKAGETVPIGQPVAIVGSGQSAGAGTPAPAPVPTAATPTGAPESNGASGRGREAAIAAPTAAPPAPRAEPEPFGEIKASPLARHMAAEHDLDLRQVPGTGPGGRIVRDDIEDYLEHRDQQAPTAAPAPPPGAIPPPAQAPAPSDAQAATALTEPLAPPPPGAEEVTLSRMQTAIARRLTESKQTVPHFYVSTEVDMTDALALRKVVNDTAGDGGVKVSVNDLIIKAVALALERFPEVNSSLRDNAFVRHQQINVGFAVDVPNGLVVPVIRDANVKGVRAIARETKALGEKARTGKLNQRELEGGTISVSNLGMMDVTEFIPIINPPEAAILGVGATRQRFVPVDGQPVVRDIMMLTMSSDHRILYGAQVARFLQEIKRLLQNPYGLLG